MEILTLLQDKLNRAHTILHELLAHYKTMSDDVRLDYSNRLLDEVNTYLQIEQNLLFPYIERSGEYDDLVRRAMQVHEGIENVSEHAIMMHVDEPWGEYYQRLVRLQALLEQARQVDRESIFPWAQLYLTEHQQAEIEIRLKGQMSHESFAQLGRVPRMATE